MDPSNGNKNNDSTLQQKLTDLGFQEPVTSRLISLDNEGTLLNSDMDERAVEALKEMCSDDAIRVLNELQSTPNIEHVSNKSALLCSLIKDFRNKQKRGIDLSSSTKKPGPDEAKLKEILERTKYSLDVTSGQRKYGGPPPDWTGPSPGSGHEIFVGRIPKEIFEDILIPLFETCGTIWNLRLMIDPSTGFSKGFCFVTYTTKESAQEAVKKYNGYEIEKGKQLKVNISIANVRLFVGNIPKNKSREDILEEFKKHTEGLIDVIIYNSPDDMKKKNRGFSFLEFDSHKSASVAKHKIGNGWTRIWGCDIIVDWADPLEEPDEEIMNKVKVLYVRNLKSSVTDDQLREAFEKFGKIERVKKVKDYCFVHFEDREQALEAMEKLQGVRVGDSDLQISLAKPPSETRQKEKRKHQFKGIYPRIAYDDLYLNQMLSSMVIGGGGRGGGGGMRSPLVRTRVSSNRGMNRHNFPYEMYGRDFRAGSFTDDYDYMTTSGTADDSFLPFQLVDSRRGVGLNRNNYHQQQPMTAPVRGSIPMWPPVYGQPHWNRAAMATHWSPTRR